MLDPGFNLGETIYLRYSASKNGKTIFLSLKLKRWGSESTDSKLCWERRKEFHILFTKHL